MSSHSRVVLFFVSLLLAPVVFYVGFHIGGDLIGAAMSICVVVACGIYAILGQPKPPAGARPL